jgi:4-hydroxythreonine-4-phosphate dehydrogenase
MYKPVVAITMGDAAGIGPEIILKAFELRRIYKICRPIIIGDARVMDYNKKVGTFESKLKIKNIQEASEADYEFGIVDVLDLKNIDLKNLVMGEPQAQAGRASYEYIFTAVRLALDKKIDAITTAPINKEAMHLGGCNYPGHTEILADMTNTKDFAMMFISNELRVILVTIHHSLKEIPAIINKERILRTIILAQKNMQMLTFSTPRIAVCGLNPHAGEKGIFGTEEIEHIVPAINDAKRLGINATGPYPADTAFYRTVKKKEFDIVVSMYHDQGCIPFKLLAFNTGVNVTVGLPIIRTSVDHGTAYGRAGKRLGTGNPKSLIEAIKMAAKLSKKRV